MRAVLVVLGVLGSGVALGGKDDVKPILGTYDVRYEEASSTCTNASITLTRGTLKIAKKKKKILVDIERFPDMFGSPRGAKIKATSKIAGTSIDGLQGRFSVAGRVDEGLIQLVMVGEYYVNDRAYCTQTWNVSGMKQKPAPKKSA